MGNTETQCETFNNAHGYPLHVPLFHVHDGSIVPSPFHSHDLYWYLGIRGILPEAVDRAQQVDNLSLADITPPKVEVGYNKHHSHLFVPCTSSEMADVDTDL